MDLVGKELCEYKNESDFTSANNDGVDNAGRHSLKIIAAITYLFGSMGNFLYLGAIHYEKFGQDAQKRSFPDRIFSFNCFLGMVGSFIFFTISTFRWIFGPVYYAITTLRYYCTSVMLCIPLGFTEGIVFRCCMIFFWKKCALIDDDFLATFFIMFNLMIINIFSLVRVMTDHFHKIEVFSIIYGEKVECEHDALR